MPPSTRSTRPTIGRRCSTRWADSCDRTTRRSSIAIEDHQEAEVVEIFERTCQGEEVEVPLVLLERLKDWRASVVQHAGATIFVVPLKGIVRT